MHRFGRRAETEARVEALQAARGMVREEMLRSIFALFRLELWLRGSSVDDRNQTRGLDSLVEDGGG